MDRAEEQMTAEKMTLIARRLFIGGFFMLPFLWLVNAFYFRRYYSHQSMPQVAKNCTLLIDRFVFYFIYVLVICAFLSLSLLIVNPCVYNRFFRSKLVDVKMSLVCFAVVQGAWFLWLIIYEINRNSWGAFGESLTVVMPKGG
jgi:glucan phosphoethanolaminetransferase (alkaline phosphatase superfamily)